MVKEVFDIHRGKQPDTDITECDKENMLKCYHPMVTVLRPKAVHSEEQQNRHLKNVTSDKNKYFIIRIVNTSARYHDYKHICSYK